MTDAARFEIGGEYRPRGGPNRNTIVITGMDEDARAYTFANGKGRSGTTILFGCEYMWERVRHEPAPAPEPEQLAAPAARVVADRAASWHVGRLVGFDLETTSTDTERTRIVKAAIVADGGGLARESLSLLADPGVPIPAEASAVHGITTEQAQADGQPAREVIAAVLVTLLNYVRAGHPLVIFNAPYDLTTLDREARRHELLPLTSHGVTLRAVDPFVTDKWLYQYREGSRKLADVCPLYGVDLADAHDALADAVAAVEVARAIATRGQVIRRTRARAQDDDMFDRQAEWARVRYDLDALHRAQERWAPEQARGLAAYFRENDRHAEADAVRPHWPLIPLEAS